MSKNVPLCGILMMVAGGLNTVFCLAFGTLMLAAPEVLGKFSQLPGSRGFGSGDKVPMILTGVLFFFWAALNVVYAIAGNSVRTFGSRTFGTVMAIVGLVPCLSGHPCCNYILTLAAGIFALVVLFNAETKANWATKGATPAAPPPAA